MKEKIEKLEKQLENTMRGYNSLIDENKYLKEMLKAKLGNLKPLEGLLNQNQRMRKALGW